MKSLEPITLNKLQALPGPGVLAAADPQELPGTGPARRGRASPGSDTPDRQHKAERVPTEELHEVRGAERYKGKDTCLGNNKGSPECVSME